MPVNKAMQKKTRIWISITLLAVIVLNYVLIGVPLYRRMNYLEQNIKAIMIKQVKSGKILKGSEDTYIMDILKKEAIAVDRKIVIVNCVAASSMIIILSWMVFGLLARRKSKIGT